jgi:hypothetical protein
VYHNRHSHSSLCPPHLPPEVEEELTAAADKIRWHNMPWLIQRHAEQAVTNTPAPQRVSDFAVGELEVGDVDYQIRHPEGRRVFAFSFERSLPEVDHAKS